MPRQNSHHHKIRERGVGEVVVYGAEVIAAIVLLEKVQNMGSVSTAGRSESVKLIHIYLYPSAITGYRTGGERAYHLREIQ